MTPALRRRFARLLVVTYVFLINAAFGMTYYLLYELQWLRDLDPSTYRRFDAYLPFALILTLLLLFAYRVDGAYDIRRDSSLVEEALEMAVLPSNRAPARRAIGSAVVLHMDSLVSVFMLSFLP